MKWNGMKRNETKWTINKTYIIFIINVRPFISGVCFIWWCILFFALVSVINLHQQESYEWMTYKQTKEGIEWKNEKEEIVAKLKKNMTYHFLAGSLTNWAILTVPFHHICVYSKQATNSAHHGATTFHHHHHHLAGAMMKKRRRTQLMRKISPSSER
jgi:hypothetical protein